MLIATLLVAGVAQRSSAQGSRDTLTLNRSAAREVSVSLANVGARVLVLMGQGAVAADTLTVMTPLRMVLPSQAFKVVVSMPEGDAVTMPATIADGKRCQRTFSGPLTISRAAPNADVLFLATRVTVDCSPQ